MREERFSTPQPVRLDCSITAGSITIATAEDPEATVSIDGPEELVSAMRVELVGENLIVSQPKSSLLDLFTRSDHSLRVEVSLPHGSGVAVKTASSDALLDGRFGTVEMQAASGDLRVTGEIDGGVTVKTASGDVRLPQVRGHLDVRGVSGDLRAESVDGSVSVALVSGDVRIESLREGEVSIRNVSGDIDLGIAPGSDVDVEASSASGRLVSEVPLSDSPSPGHNPTVVIRGTTASGDFRLFRAGPVHAA